MENPGAFVDQLDSCGHICLVPVFFRIALRHYSVLSPREGWDAFGINCKKDTTTDIKTQAPSIMARGVCFIIRSA